MDSTAEVLMIVEFLKNTALEELSAIKLGYFQEKRIRLKYTDKCIRTVLQVNDHVHRLSTAVYLLSHLIYGSSAI